VAPSGRVPGDVASRVQRDMLRHVHRAPLPSCTVSRCVLSIPGDQGSGFGLERRGSGFRVRGVLRDVLCDFVCSVPLVYELGVGVGG